MLEELLALGHSGAEYDAWLIRIGEGDQFGSGFVAVNPNSKIPALMDYAANRHRRSASSNPARSCSISPRSSAPSCRKDPARRRTSALNWLFWQMGSTPYLGGGFGHFYAYAPEKIEYPINRFAMEVKRQLDVLDRQLASNRYIAGDEYTIADMAIWPWYGAGGSSTAGSRANWRRPSRRSASRGSSSPGRRCCSASAQASGRSPAC
jgi:GSH-dependent disulfide-bond oxidoreductase